MIQTMKTLTKILLAPRLQGISPAFRRPDRFLRQVTQRQETVEEASAAGLSPSVFIVKRLRFWLSQLEPLDQLHSFTRGDVMP
jgi:hypothetical protein